MNTKEELWMQIEKTRQELDSSIDSREDLAHCQKLSEELDLLIEKYMNAGEQSPTLGA